KNICRSIVFISFLFLIIFPAHRSFAIEHKLPGQNLTENDRFATSVAVDGDYVVIGTPGDNNRQGSVSIFSRNQDGTNAWGLVIQLSAFDGSSNDVFGNSVAISGQYVIIGAPGNDDSGTDAGAAYIYARNQGGNDHWGLVATLLPETTMDQSNFGSAVTISGNYAVVGAPGDDDNDTDAGAIYIYARNQGGADNWGLMEKLYAEDSIFIDGNPDNFGASVAIDGDYTIIGAPGTDDGSIDSGVAYIFYRNQEGNNNWGQQAKLAASDGGAYYHFAEAVSISGSIALVGSAVDSNSNGSQAGAAYFFYQNLGGTDNWEEQSKVIASDGNTYDYFGTSVAISDNYAIIGSPGADIQEPRWGEGAAYILGRNQGGTDNWGEVDKLTASDGDKWDFFGTSVAINGGYDAVVGTPDKDDNTGAAYVFDHNENNSAISVGSAAGFVTVNVSATALLTLQVNTSNTHNDLPAQTWLVFMLVKGVQTSSLYLLSNTAVKEVTATTNFDNSQFTFTGTPAQTLVTLHMADLGLQSGDNFYYAYAYSTSDISGVIIENIVEINVQ
ncbi:MAG: hypothetical protein KAW01_01930, partial [Deltaproteobacteria bacterium]|nr:hypothetical protein [Deltaproteobacteria bacterium]